MSKTNILFKCVKYAFPKIAWKYVRIIHKILSTIIWNYECCHKITENGHLGDGACLIFFSSFLYNRIQDSPISNYGAVAVLMIDAV